MGLLDENTRCRLSTKVEHCLEYRTFPEVLTKSMTETLQRGQNRLLGGPERNTSLKLRTRTEIQEGLLSADMEGVQWPPSSYPVCRIPRDRQPRPRPGRKESEPTSLHVPFRHNKSAGLPQLSACYILHLLGTRKSGSVTDKTTRPTFRAHHYGRGRFLFTPFFRLPWMRRREKGKKSDIAPVPREGGREDD